MHCPSCGTQNEPDSRFCGGCGARLAAGKSQLAPTQKVTNDANEIQPRAQAMTPAPLPVAGPSSVIPGTPVPGPISISGAPAPVVTLPRPSGAHAQRGSSVQSAAPAPRSASTPASALPLAPPPPTEPQHPSGPRSIPGTSGVPGAGAGGMPGMSTRPGGGSIPPGTSTRPGGGGIPPSTSAGAGPGGPGPAAGGGIPGTGGSSRPQPARGLNPVQAAASGRRWAVIISVLVIDLGLAIAGGWLLHEGLAAGEPAPLPPEQPPPPRPRPSPPASQP